MDQLSQATRKITEALLSGGHYTSAELNRIGQTVDSRKVISRLRRRPGFAVCDYVCRKEGRRYKRYYCPGWVITG